MRFNRKKKAIEERIKSLENDLAKAHEYLETGTHANWVGFRPLFKEKIRNGRAAPPHKDWVKNVFIPRCERALRKDEKRLESIG